MKAAFRLAGAQVRLADCFTLYERSVNRSLSITAISFLFFLSLSR